MIRRVDRYSVIAQCSYTQVSIAITQEDQAGGSILCNCIYTGIHWVLAVITQDDHKHSLMFLYTYMGVIAQEDPVHIYAGIHCVYDF